MDLNYLLNLCFRLVRLDQMILLLQLVRLGRLDPKPLYFQLGLWDHLFR